MAKSEKFLPLRAVIEDHTASAIQRAGGNMTKAAKLLGVGRATLYRRAGPDAGTQNTHFPRDGSVPGALKKRLDELRATTEENCHEPGCDYELGIANGLILARHIMEGRPGSPVYL